MTIKKVILIVALVVGAFLRLFNLHSYPALNADEAALGYNAYSLLETGKDEHGNAWPLHFQSFNDYKPGLYVYLILPFVKVMGLTELAVRIPGAVIGILSIVVIYLLARQLTDKKYVAELSALFLAISPWHIHFSRGGWEVNVATFFMMLGVFLFSTKKTKYLFFSAISFALALYTYHAARIIVPLLLVCLATLYWRDFKKHLKVVIIAMIFGVIITAPLARDIFSGAVVSRAAGVGLFADTGPFSRINEQRGEHGNYAGIIPKLLHNKPTNYGLAFMQNWAEHYWGQFLFLSGDDIERNKVPETGQMYLYLSLFLGIGLVLAFRLQKSWLFVLLWLAIAPLAAALTFQSPHALRAHNMVIPLTLLGALGAAAVFEWLQKNKKYGQIGTIAVGAIMFWQFVQYQHMFWVHMSREYPFSSQYGVKELVNYLADKKDNYKNIVVTDRYDQPYILFLFYIKYPPSKFQGNHTLTERDSFGFSTVRQFDNFVFKQISFDGDRVTYPNSLIVGTDEQIPKEMNIIEKIYGTNDHLYFEIVEN